MNDTASDKQKPWYASMASSIPFPNDNDDDSGNSDVNGSLYVGGLAAAQNAEFIQKCKITHVLTVARALPVTIPVNANEVKHLIVECRDHPMENILRVLPKCLEYINNAFDDTDTNARVLVHCASGVSRSVTVCAAFLMTRFHMKSTDAIASIASVRRFANPNLGFKRQLAILDKCICNANSDSQKEHVIEEAQKEFSKVTSNDIVENTIRQRNVVNDLYAKVDVLEERLAMTASRKGEEKDEKKEKDGIRTSLLLLMTELDSCLPTESEGLVDPPARMVRKVAVAKIDRLLQSLESVDESTRVETVQVKRTTKHA